ncbi:uncharacterized protein BDR25DRAFT_376117 [Lindgomyces ingoldianus]|uniref:Uncharacterized protein n=1 Tax=Lindgomyces ingoldianus TaxID=673940 RepID=A0ACB6QLP3_9PLEO|nr:uncharacterized protein BDR25DRAFT_376117 [Lindgomyces ingoldianus]KAF2467232.1 hypothetical protein BDR25DRAFT_376117 [Lindgomyces ingoldianus]
MPCLEQSLVARDAPAVSSDHILRGSPLHNQRRPAPALEPSRHHYRGFFEGTVHFPHTSPRQLHTRPPRDPIALALACTKQSDKQLHLVFPPSPCLTRSPPACLTCPPRPARRGAPVANTAKGRLPIGTPGQLAGSSSHSHIQIVPREENEFIEAAERDRDNLPTFRSPSLQYPPSATQQSRKAHGSTNIDPEKGKTFADMARRFTNKDFVHGEERATSGPVSLARLVPFQQPTRKKGSKWRYLQQSDFPDDDEDDDGNETDHGELRELANNFTRQVGLEPPQRPRSAPRASPSNLPPLQTNASSLHQRRVDTSEYHHTSDASAALTRANSEDISPTNTRHIMDEKTRVFGEKPLPDPIRLREQMGDFDGHVVFIAHPNRDISAHQWSLPAFQWINIGAYSQNRRKIEGSLTSDRLKSGNIPYDSLQYFKGVAEQREKHIVEHGRQEERKLPDPASILRVETLSRPAFTDPDRFASLSSTSDSTADPFPTLNQFGPPRVAVPSRNQAPTPSLRTLAKDFLDDPFVTPARPPQPAIPVTFNPINRGMSDLRGGGGQRAMGSMDFQFEFPPSSNSPQETRTAQPPSGPESRRQIFIQREQERIRRELRPQERQAELDLREIDVGEDAMSGYDAPDRRPTVARPQVPPSPEDVQTRQKLKSKLAELGDQALRGGGQGDGRVAVPDLPSRPAAARNLFPPPGLTVANPHRVVSTLNATAPPYTHLPQDNRPIPHSDSDSDATATNVPTATNLKFSDPDGIRQVHNREIASGLGHQGPTPQNFKGPFFADTIPTSHNPTAPLSFQVDEQDKLRNWFSDGQRPARQEEYYKSIMATANANARTRNMTDLEVIGDGSSRNYDPHNFANSRAFIRLYENLREYMEESIAQQGDKDYFTRGWKPAPLHLRDLGVTGSQSFFEDTSPINNRACQGYSGPSWGGFGLNHTAPNGRFGGPGPSRR